jgi:hypothetical protein
MGGDELTVVPVSVGRDNHQGNKQPHDKVDDQKDKKDTRKKRKKVMGLSSLTPNEWVTVTVRCNSFSLFDVGTTKVILRDGHTSRVRIDVVGEVSGAYGGFSPNERIEYFKASTTIKFNESVVDTNTMISHVEGDTVRLMALKLDLPQELHETGWPPNFPPDLMGDHTDFNV